jgi:DNA-binding NarL/FixJ family response regulator
MSTTPIERVTRIEVVTPQAVVAGGIRVLLEGTHNGRTIAAARPSGRPPDIVFYDVIGLHQGDGSDLDALVETAASTVVAVTRDLRPDLGAAALERGARAAIPLGACREEFLEIIDAALSGHLGESPVAKEARVGTRAGSEVGLTKREAEIVAMIVRGRSNRQIAQDCVLSINSVKSYIRSAYRKMDVYSRSQAVAWGIQHGFALDEPRSAPPEILARVV